MINSRLLQWIPALVCACHLVLVCLASVTLAEDARYFYTENPREKDHNHGGTVGCGDYSTEADLPDAYRPTYTQDFPSVSGTYTHETFDENDGLGDCDDGTIDAMVIQYETSVSVVGGGDPKSLTIGDEVELSFSVTLVSAKPKVYQYMPAAFAGASAAAFYLQHTGFDQLSPIPSNNYELGLGYWFVNVGQTITDVVRFEYTGGGGDPSRLGFYLSTAPWGCCSIGMGPTFHWCKGPGPAPFNQTVQGLGGCDCRCGPGSGSSTCPIGAGGGTGEQKSFSSAGGAGSGCTGCGGSSPGGANTPPLNLSSRIVPDHAHIAGSFGPGAVSNFDFSLTAHRSGDSNSPSYPVITGFDPETGNSESFENPGGNLYTGCPNVCYTSFNADGATTAGDNGPVSDLSGATTTMSRNDGTDFEFEFVPDPASNGDMIGRLMAIIDANGQRTELTYDPAAALEIATITAPDGVQIVPHYVDGQGQRVWGSATISNYEGSEDVVINYVYAPPVPDGANAEDHPHAEKLTSVIRDNVTVAIYSRSDEPNIGRDVIEFTVPQDPSASGKIYVTSDYMSWPGATGSDAIQYAGITTKREDGAGNTVMELSPDSATPGLFYVEGRGQLMKWVPGQSLQYIQNWSGDSSSGYTYNANAQETVFACNPVSTPQTALTGQHPITIDETGYRTDHEYDGRGNLVKTIYRDDGNDVIGKDDPYTPLVDGNHTYELWVYDDNNDLVYYRDRGGFVTLTQRDDAGRVLRVIRGLEDIGTADTLAEQSFGPADDGTKAIQEVTKYYADPHSAAGLMEWTGTDAYTGSNVTVTDWSNYNWGSLPVVLESRRTSYTYDTNNRLDVVTKPLPALVDGSMNRPTVSYDWAGAQLASMTDERGNEMAYEYDALGRSTRTRYHDGSSEQVGYSSDGLITYRRDRNGVVSKQVRDAAGRVIESIQAYGKYDGPLVEPVSAPGQSLVLDDSKFITNDTWIHQITTYGYDSVTTRLATTRVNGALTKTEYDYRGRVARTIQRPHKDVYRITDRVYKNNLLFSQEDLSGVSYYAPLEIYYGGNSQKQLMAYGDNRQKVRVIMIRDALAKQAYDSLDNMALLNLEPLAPETAQPTHVITDAVRDERGNVVCLVDGYGTQTVTLFDALGRSTKRTRQGGTGNSAISLVESMTSYGPLGRMVESENAAGVKTTYGYDDADNISSQTVGGTSPGALTTLYRFDPDGVQTHVTAPGTYEEETAPGAGGITEIIREDCCGRRSATQTAEGDGQIVVQDFGGRTVHTSTVEDFSTATGGSNSIANPDDDLTVSETTTSYFDNGRVQYRAVWIEPLVGIVTPEAPQIAGIIGITDPDKGVTTQYVYDDNLADDSGLDVEAGQTIGRLRSGGGNTIHITEALIQLAHPTNIGGAGIQFDSDSPGSATVVIAPDEKTMRVSIADAMGRTVMTALMHGPRATEDEPNELIDWTCIQHDVGQFASTPAVNGFLVGVGVRRIDRDGKTNVTVADGFGQTIFSVDELGRRSFTLNDAAGNPLRMIDALGHETLYSYDLLGRQRTMTDSIGGVTKTEYNAIGQVWKRLDAKNSGSTGNNVPATEYTYDALGRLEKTTDRVGGETVRTYDSSGRLHLLKDAEDKITEYQYNRLGQRTSVRLADSATNGNKERTYQYDAAGRVTQMELPSGKTQVSTYELSGVLDKREHFASTNTSGTAAIIDDMTYDPFLRLTKTVSTLAGQGSFTRDLTYTDRGQLKQDSFSGHDVNYEYDDRSRLELLTYPSGRKVEYTYEERSLVDTIKWDDAQIEDRTYNEIGLLTGVTRPGAVPDETRGYDLANRLTSISNPSVGDLAYTYDANHNKKSELWGALDSMVTWSFRANKPGAPFPDGYDEEDRLRRFHRVLQANGEKTLDRSAIGNITSVNPEGGASVSRTYNDAHELKAVGNATQEFDVDGNLFRTYKNAYLIRDAANRLSQVYAPPNYQANKYFYDARGKRVRTDVGTTRTIYIYAGPNCIAEYDFNASSSASPKQEYVYAGSIDSLVMLDKRTGAAGTTGKFHVTRNQQNSVTALVDTAGNVKERYTYDVFGERTVLDEFSVARTTNASVYNNPYGYTSRRHDPSGLMYFRARYYDPTTGEFTSQDPLEYVDGMSLYRGYFVPGNVDPTGLKAKCEKPPRKCVVTSGPEYYGITALFVQRRSGIKYKTFHFRASFSSTEGQCECCEVRQKIMWDLLAHSPDDEGIGGGPPHDGFKHPDNTPGNWHEDRNANDDHRYGHRDNPRRNHDYYVKDQKTGCHYEGRDTPQNPPPTWRQKGKWVFKVEVIDVCAKGSPKPVVAFTKNPIVIDWSAKGVKDDSGWWKWW